MLTIQGLQRICRYARDAFGDSAIVAGGAPRDVLSGVSVKDIDVFVCAQNVDMSERAAYFSALVGGTVSGVTRPNYPNAFQMVDIMCTALPPIQVVELGVDPVDDVHNYDFDLSQVFVTPNGYFMTDAARWARDTKTIGYIDRGQDDAGKQRSRNRLARLREKYGAPWIFGASCAVL